jgi:hypothetical protein
VCLDRQQQSAASEDKKDGEDFAGDCEHVLHNKANNARCVLCCQIKNHAGANFFLPLLPALGFVGAKRLGDPPMANLIDAKAAARSMSEGSRFPAAAKQSSHQVNAAR